MCQATIDLAVLMVILLPSASPVVHPSAAWSQRHGMACVSRRLMQPGLLQCHP